MGKKRLVGLKIIGGIFTFCTWAFTLCLLFIPTKVWISLVLPPTSHWGLAGIPLLMGLSGLSSLSIGLFFPLYFLFLKKRGIKHYYAAFIYILLQIILILLFTDGGKNYLAKMIREGKKYSISEKGILYRR